jgi:hypothetical protein
MICKNKNAAQTAFEHTNEGVHIIDCRSQITRNLRAVHILAARKITVENVAKLKMRFRLQWIKKKKE